MDWTWRSTICVQSNLHYYYYYYYVDTRLVLEL